jgi:sulfatase maturation enzyme AslB (radical SAM superfamily)|tara:strand:- start:93 stop:632 length:540 start_codon:yes stop_codon:yes gene_type:complete
MKKIFYSSCIFNKDNEPSVLEASFTLVKQFNCFTKYNLDLMIDKLERLKKENFNRIHIPDFEYSVEGNIISYNTVFIKGWGVGIYVPDFANIIYEDVVQRDSDWTFDDFGGSNFIVEHNTDKIFAVDFQSYNYIPNRDYRISKWEKFKNLNFNMLKDLAKGKWTNPARHPLRKNYESNF